MGAKCTKLVRFWVQAVPVDRPCNWALKEGKCPNEVNHIKEDAKFSAR